MRNEVNHDQSWDDGPQAGRREHPGCETPSGGQAGPCVDKVLVCQDCEGEYVYPSTLQRHHAEMGYTREPKRCPTCRGRRRLERLGQRVAERENQHRKPMERFPAVCSECGAQTRVPFSPAPNRPVFCRTCHQARRAT